MTQEAKKEHQCESREKGREEIIDKDRNQWIGEPRLEWREKWTKVKIVLWRNLGMSNQEKQEKSEGLKTHNIKGMVTTAEIEMRQSKNTLWTIISTKFEYVEEISKFMEISNSFQNWEEEIKNINKNQRKLNDEHKSFLKQTPNPAGFTGGFC